MAETAKSLAALDVTPNSAALGAEVRGLDLAGGVTPGEAEALRALLAEHLLLVLPGRPLAPEHYVAFARALGEIAVEPFVAPMAGHPEIIEVLKEADEGRVAVFGESWHSDFTFLESPPMATLLHALETPRRGGDTLYVNGQRAYEALSDGMKALIEPLWAVHEGGRFYGSQGQFYDKASPYGDKTLKHLTLVPHPDADGEVLHPVVRRHPVTGRPGLFVNEAYTLRLKDMSAEESRPLLGFLFDWLRRPEFSCRLAWRPGQVAIWDNRATLHKAVNDYDGETRRMWRITLAGDRPQAYRPA